MSRSIKEGWYYRAIQEQLDKLEGAIEGLAAEYEGVEYSSVTVYCMDTRSQIMEVIR